MEPRIDAYAVARLRGSAQIQPGAHHYAASPCYGDGRGVAVVELLPGIPSPRCLQVEPDERIIFVNRTDQPADPRPTPVTIRLGDYEARIKPQEAALFPMPVGRYLGIGLHGAVVKGAPGPAILVIRPGCSGGRGGKLTKPLARCI